MNLMDAILQYLLNMFLPLQVSSPEIGFRLVSIMTDQQAAVGLKLDQLPACLLSSQGEEFIAGDIANVHYRHYKIKLRFFWGSVVRQAPLTQNKINIYQLTDQLLGLLIQDKKLGGLVRGMNGDIKVTDLPVVGSFQGDYLGRDLLISYTQYVRWDSEENNQPDFVLPEGVS